MGDLQHQPLAHVPVLATEAPEILIQDPDGIYVDGTFGRGGHSRLFLEKLSPKGRLIAFDRDLQAVESAKSIEDPRFQIIHSPFSDMAEKLAEIGVSEVNGVFLDIGVSSPQIDDPNRGFSFRFDGPLDMRMDQSQGTSAAEWLATADQKEIARVIKEYGEEKFAGKMAAAIVREREIRPIDTTGKLAQLAARTIPKSKGDKNQHPATRTFQAIRIHINGELDQLKSALGAAGKILLPEGRLAVISFHSLEDRIVKKFFEHCAHPEADIDPRLPLRPDQLPQPLFEHAKRVLPSESEKAVNPRARSSILRYAVRTGSPWRDLP